MVGIFRTNIYSEQDKNKVISAIRLQFDVYSCSIDLEDCDKVLRIVSAQDTIEESDVINFMQSIGFQCDILD